VVQHFYAQQFAGSAESVGCLAIFSAWFMVAARMGMSENNTGGPVG
jgi:hypothetical protein